MKAGSISRYTAPISVEPAEVPVGGPPSRTSAAASPIRDPSRPASPLPSAGPGGGTPDRAGGARPAHPGPEPARLIAAIGRPGGDQRSQAPAEPALLTYL